MFSKACEYGIRASVFIAIKSRQGVRVSLNEIALGTDSPVRQAALKLKIPKPERSNSIRLYMLLTETQYIRVADWDLKTAMKSNHVPFIINLKP